MTACLFKKRCASNVVHAHLISIDTKYKCFDVQMQVIRVRITN